MEEQRFFIKGVTFAADDERLQDALARVYDTPERPRCMCVPGGIEMYVARHRLYVVKRMPETGTRHHASCPSYESELHQSGLGELMGESIIEHSAESVELRVDFPLVRMPGRTVPRGEPSEPSEVSVPRRRMSLRAVMHFLFERAGMNRWTPKMEGKRNQGVLHRYLMEAAEDVTTKGVRLSERLYVPEPFSEATKSRAAERRRSKLALLQAPDGESQFRMALVLGEFKCSEATPLGRKVWVKHMPDAPLFINTKAWERIERVYGSLFEARDADTPRKPRVVMCALIYAKREHIYQIDKASFMLTTDQWVPVDGIHEIGLIDALVAQQRRFIKPLRYDANSAAPFPNALLLDAGDTPLALHVVSAFMEPKERGLKEKTLKVRGAEEWVWITDMPMPALPVVIRKRAATGQ
ncbi:DUF1173 domain-containing protein [Undibacterium sp. Jales W-56]|uniref:DUF1173 domain-containing protein n=1 Tax=Undibacterium sp. Jales W-56 TaxID=2897325 RepID=UPI0021D38B39|nr:DUF1173 domain-containing protein [Undibacterium sp. Jales W-56]MCU6435308.1 DUF1173 domain-containing protein [Undibacterium sp. Jales W-56]